MLGFLVFVQCAGPQTASRKYFSVMWVSVIRPEATAQAKKECRMRQLWVRLSLNFKALQDHTIKYTDQPSTLVTHGFL